MKDGKRLTLPKQLSVPRNHELWLLKNCFIASKEECDNLTVEGGERWLILGPELARTEWKLHYYERNAQYFLPLLLEKNEQKFIQLGLVHQRTCAGTTNEQQTAQTQGSA